MTLKKSAVLIAVSYVIKIFSGLIINKLLAIFVGPSGIALMGQFRSFVQMITILSTGGINSGVVKLIASNKTDTRTVSRIKSISLSIALIFSVVLTVGIIIFDKNISFYLFKNSEYTLFIDVFAISLIFFSLNQILLFFINGEGDTRLYTYINIIQSILILLLSIGFVTLYKLEGALIVVGISQVLISFVSVYFVTRNNIYSFNNFSFLLKDVHTKLLFSYSFITIVNALSVALSLIFIRNIMIDKFGEVETGYWQSVWNISEVYLGFVTMLLSVHFYPRISSMLNQSELLKNEIKQTTLFVVGISFSIILITFIFKEWIVLLLYSEDFLRSLIFFKYQLIGDFFKIISWVFGYYMLSITATKSIVIATIVSSVMFVILVDILTNIYGVLGVNYAYSIVYLGYLIFTFLFFWKHQ